jgi:hypothetical protein
MRKNYPCGRLLAMALNNFVFHDNQTRRWMSGELIYWFIGTGKANELSLNQAKKFDFIVLISSRT